MTVTTPLEAQAGVSFMFSVGGQNYVNWTSNIRETFIKIVKPVGKIFTTGQLAQCLDLDEITALVNSVFRSLLISVVFLFFSLGLSFGKQKRPSKFIRWKRTCGKIVSEESFYNPCLSSWVVILFITGLT